MNHYLDIIENIVERDVKNHIFAIETNLDPLIKRIKEGRIPESLEIIDSIKSCLEKMKEASSAILCETTWFAVEEKD